MKTIALFTGIFIMAVMAQAKETRKISEEIIINAPAGVVWSVLSDNAEWEAWNPFIYKSKGELVEGQKIRNHMKLESTGKEFIFTPRVLSAKENQELVWIGRFIMPGIFDGEHHFELIETRADQVRLVQYEHFSGILAGMMLRKIEDQTREGFRKMNQALKERSEARHLAEK